jgi:hypothetical protein
VLARAASANLAGVAGIAAFSKSKGEKVKSSK